MTDFIDLNHYDGPDDIQCEVCIAGAGAAGIVLARQLANRGVSVVLLESGGTQLDADTQLLYEGTNTGLPYWDLMACRLRYLGGTTNHWGGITNHLSELDMSRRPEVGLPGWPLSHAEIMPYVRQAAELLEVEFERYQPAAALEREGNDPALMVERQSPLLSTISFATSERKRFAAEFGADLAARENLRLFLNANVTHIQLDPGGGAVRHFEAASLAGKRIRVSARAHVLACHAIENARLLLLSNDVQQQGIGNRSDQLGRNFMEHVYVETGQLLGTDALPAFYLGNVAQRKDPVPRNATGFVVALSDAARQHNEMLSYYVNFNVVYADEAIYRSLSYLRSSLFEPFSPRIWQAMTGVMSDLVAAGRITQEELGLRSRKIGYLQLHHRIEQAPNPSSRITLIDERDALGLPKVNLHWDITDLELHSFKRGQDLVVQELSALGIGRFAPEPMTEERVRSQLRGHYHHMGTTRMSGSATSGVVNGDCRVHEVANLYVAGSSTFPTAGRSGPTLTIIALALRLADHLATRVRADVARGAT
ncbi:MAG: GMC oxidoreductase [Pseudomonadales bacterium]